MLGDVEGRSAESRFSDVVFKTLCQSPMEAVRNHPFKGGFITRKFGKPHEGVHALQLEMCQHLYMEEMHPFPYNEVKAGAVAKVIRSALEAFIGG